MSHCCGIQGSDDRAFAIKLAGITNDKRQIELDLEAYVAEMHRVADLLEEGVNDGLFDSFSIAIGDESHTMPQAIGIIRKSCESVCEVHELLCVAANGIFLGALLTTYANRIASIKNKKSSG